MPAPSERDDVLRFLLRALVAAGILSVGWASPGLADGADPTPPSVASFSATTPVPVTGTTISYELVFDEPITGLAASDFVIRGSSTGWSVAGVSGAEATYGLTLSAPTAVAGTVVLRLRPASVVDGAGTAGPAEAVRAPRVEVVPPSSATGSIVINGGASTTTDPTLNLTLTTDGFGGDLEMRFSLDGGATWTGYRTYAESHVFALPAKWRWGTATVSAELRDGAGTSIVVADSVAYVQAARSTMSLRPRYVLKSTLDYGRGRLTTRQTVDISNASKSLIGYLDFSVLARHYGEMAVQSVTVDGAPVEVLYNSSANMRVPLGYNLRAGDEAVVAIDFTATATSSTSDYLRSRFAKANGLMQISAWHPVLSNGHGLRHPGDSQFTVVADYRLELTHPASVVIAAPGDLLASTSTTKTYSLERAREYAFAASPDFARKTATTSTGVKVAVYHLPSARKPSVALSTTVAALERYADRLGRYPYQRFVLAQGARSTTGLEYSGIAFVGGLNFNYKLMIAHEVAHQWWYGIVGNDQLAEPWLDESFAEYTSRWVFGYAMPKYCSKRPVNSAVSEFANKPSSQTACGSYDQTIYAKGARFLEGVRERLGTAKFFDALRVIVAENRFGVVSTDIVRATFLRFSADRPALGAYMNGWLR